MKIVLQFCHRSSIMQSHLHKKFTMTNNFLFLPKAVLLFIYMS